MADFGDNFDVDPAAEFLAREQDELAGLEDELRPAAVTIPVINGGEKLLTCFCVGGAYLR